MSKLSKLIKELCPEGVEYRPLGEIGSFERGRRFVKADAVESDGIPCVHYGELYTHYGLWANVHKSQIRSDIQTKLRYAEKNDVIIVGAGENNIDIGIAVAWLGDYKVAVHDACYIFKHQQDPKYISYLLRTNSYHQQIKKFVSEGKICSISAENLAKAVLPFPPVPIQQEVVRILDRYTELEEQLESELKAELEARKLQYEYYRNQLLNFAPPRSENVKWVKLGDVCETLSGFPFDSSNFRDDGIRLMRGANVKRGYFDFSPELNKYWENSEGLEKYLLETNDIIISMDGSLVGRSFCYLKNEHLPLLLVQRVARIRTKENFKFIYYNIQKSFPDYVDKKKTAGTIPHISMKDNNNFTIPLPSKKEQDRIASILDRFETLTIELQNNMPAEIKARRQQYEYYREKLLTFKRKAA